MSKPRYQLVADGLRADIESGQYAPGDKLPTKPELMQRFGVALATLDRGLDVLREEQIIETFHGVGTFVKEPPPQPISIPEELAELKDRLARLEAQATDIAELKDRLAHVEAQVIDVYANMGMASPEQGRVEEAG